MPANMSKAKAGEKAYYEKLSKFYHEIASGEVPTLPDLEIDEIKNAKATNVNNFCLQFLSFPQYNRNLLHLAVWYKQNDIVSQICEKEELKCLINEQDNVAETSTLSY